MNSLPVHLADLLRSMARLPDKTTWADAAAALGYDWLPTKRQQELPATPRDTEPVEPATPAAASAPAEAANDEATQPHFWRVTADLSHEQQLNEPDWLREARANPGPEGCFESDGVVVLPRPAPLVPPARLARFLRQRLAVRAPGTDVDIVWVVQRLARGEPVVKLRRQSRLRWPLRVQVVVQTHATIAPLSSDLRFVAHQLQRQLGDRARLLTCPGGPQRMLDDMRRPARLHADGSPVLVLGDAGQYQTNTRARRDWQDWALRLQRAGTRPLLLAPVPARWMQGDTLRAFDVALLDESARLRLQTRAAARPSAAPSSDEPSNAVRALAGLLAGIAGVDGALLRLARRALRGAVLPRPDVATEVELMQQPGVAWDDAYCRVLPQAEAQAFADLCGLVPSAAVARLMAQMQQWMKALSPLLQAERQQAIARHGRELPQLIPDASALAGAEQHAQQLWAWMAAALQRDPRESQLGLAAYVVSVGHHNPSFIGHAPAQLQTAWALANPRLFEANSASKVAIPEGVKLEQLAWLAPTGPAQALVFEGSGLGALLRLVPETRAGPNTLCVGLPYAASVGVERIKEHTSDIAAPQQHAQAEQVFECSKSSAWRLHIGSRCIELDAITLPPWAAALWREGADLFAELPDGRTLRWVPRTSFEVLAPAQGVPRFELKLGAWWDDAEYREFVGADRRLRCPNWANAGHGTDGFGYWAAFSIDDVTQTLRFVPPGTFDMGSPEDEPGRFDNERQHRVRLTRGFWIADTACTQALWQAVTGNNPSGFPDNADNPAERVSWNDVHGSFLSALERLAPGIGLRLPSEAEWEYAARCAGQATGSFSWGEGITAEQANYDGNYPLPNQAKGEYRARTLPVKHLDPNLLGLWQMHGNVLEWVEDAMREYPEGEVFDPTESGAAEEAAGLRVLRGGSWIDDARDCRSARRLADPPAERSHFIGFRLARGLPVAGRAETARALGEPEARHTGGGPPEPAARQRGRAKKSAKVSKG